jgi:hypothetical protein
VGDTRPATSSPGEIRLRDRYTLGPPISSGAMGAVYRARDHEVAEEVAIKRLLDTRHAARFTVEARLLSQLRHPRVVRVIDHFQDETGMYLVMQLVRGTDLRRLLSERGEPGLTVTEAVEHTRQACDALQYVHDQQIVHRDVKPENLILSEDGVVLVDFGIARQIDADHTGTIGIGTPRFMAPEVLTGGAVSPRSDVFSIAATLWTLVVGAPPVYGGRSDLARQLAHLDEGLRDALCRGLELVPEHRISSVEEFAQALGSPLVPTTGVPLAMSVSSPSISRALLEGVVRTAAGVFEAASASIALVDPGDGKLAYQAAWGAGAREIVGVKLPKGAGIAGSVVRSGQGLVVPSCQDDPRFSAQVAAGTGYVPNTMLVVPLKRSDETIGALSILDRRDGGSYGPGDVVRAGLFADLAVASLELESAGSQGADPGEVEREPTGSRRTGRRPSDSPTVLSDR